MPTFTLDICKDKTREQLCADYRRTSRALCRWMDIALALGASNPEAVAKLPEEWRKEVTRTLEAYKD